MRREKERRSASRAWRIFRAVAIVLAGVAALYAVGVNVLLSTPLLRWLLNGDPEMLDVHYARAWSLWPGRVHARDLSIRSTDSHVEWILRIDDVDFDVSLTALARKHFHVRRMRGRGVSFRLRQKLDSMPAPGRAGAQVADLPPIEGLPPYDVNLHRPNGPEYWNDADWHLWTIDLENVDSEHTREVWVDHQRFEGDAHVTGRFHLRPIRSVEVGPAHVEVADGVVQRGATTLADHVGGAFELHVARFDPRLASGDDVLHGVSGWTELSLGCPDVGGLLPASSATTIAGPLEAHRVAVRVERGALSDGSHVDGLARARVARGAMRAEGPISFAADVADGRISVHANAAGVEVTRDDDRLLHVGALAARADSRELDLARPFGDLHVSADLTAIDAADLRPLAADLPADAPVHVEGGRAHAEARLEAWLRERRAAGRLSLIAPDVEVRAGPLRARATLGAQASLGSFSWSDGRLAGEAHVEVRDVTGFAGARGQRPGEPVFRAGRLRVSARTREAVSLKAPSWRAIDGSIAIEDAVVPDLRALAPLILRGGSLTFERGAARASGELTAHAGGVAGDARVDLVGAGVRVGSTHLVGDVFALAHLKASDPAQGIADLSGSRVTVRELHADGGPLTADHWQGEVRLERATLRLPGGPRLDGRLVLDARDAEPLVDMLARRVPGVVAKMAEMPGLRGSAWLSADARGLCVDDLRAQGGDLAVLGVFARRDARRRGAFVIRKGLLSVGVALDDDGGGVRLFDLDGWMREQAAVTPCRMAARPARANAR